MALAGVKQKERCPSGFGTRGDAAARDHVAFSAPMSRATSDAIETGPARWHHCSVLIRDAVPEDAQAGCIVMKRSIAELCGIAPSLRKPKSLHMLAS